MRRATPDSKRTRTSCGRPACEAALGATTSSASARAAVVVLSPGVPPDAPPVGPRRTPASPSSPSWTSARGSCPHAAHLRHRQQRQDDDDGARRAPAARGGAERRAAAGNIGNPVCAGALRAAPAWLAVECSSFQLHDVAVAPPGGGVVTNLSPNHLDRYASLDAYYGDKRLLFRNARRREPLGGERGR